MKVCWLNICRETSSGINISTETCCARSFIAWATVFEQLDQYLCPKWRKLSFFFGFVYNGKRILSKFPEFTAANTPTPKVNSPSHRAKLHLCFNLANNRLTTSNNHIASLADVTKLNQQPLESNENKQTNKKTFSKIQLWHYFGAISWFKPMQFSLKTHFKLCLSKNNK